VLPQAKYAKSLKSLSSEADAREGWGAPVATLNAERKLNYLLCGTHTAAV